VRFFGKYEESTSGIVLKVFDENGDRLIEPLITAATKL
jgi:hypothetical protein